MLGLLELLQHVAANVDVTCYTCFVQGHFLFAGATRQIERACSRGFQGQRRPDRFGGIDLVRRAQANKLRARRLKRRHHLGQARKAVVRHRFDAAGLEEILREGRARGEVRKRAKVGEKDLRPRAILRQHRVGGVSQRLERLREPHRWQRRKCRGDQIIRRRDRRHAEHGDRRLREVGEVSAAGEHVLAAGDRFLPLGAYGGDLLLDHALFERREGAARLLDLLERPPGGVAELRGQILDAAGAGGGIGHFGEVRFFEQHQLGIAGDPPRECIRQAERERERQCVHGVGAAKPGGHDCDRSPQHIHVGIALGHRSPCGFCGDECRLWRKRAGLLDPHPQLSQGAQLGDGQELVGVGGEAERDHGARGIEGDATRFERAQILDGDREHERELLRLGATGIVDDATVGRRERAAKSLVAQVDDRGGKARRQALPRLRAAARCSRGPDRVEPEAHLCCARRDRTAIDQGNDRTRGGLALCTRIDVERDAGIEIDVGERARDRGVVGETVAIGADRAREHQRQAVGAVLKIIQGLRIGGGRIGVIDALHDRPRRARRPPGDRPGIGLARIEWRDGESVIGCGDEALLERRAFEHAIHQFAPLFLPGRRKLGRKRQVVGGGIGHGRKLPRHKWKVQIAGQLPRRLTWGLADAAAAFRCRSGRPQPAHPAPGGR